MWSIVMEKRIIGLVCGAVGLVLYLNTLKCGFCYDDKAAVLENADLHTSAPWTNLLWNDFWGKPLQLNTSHKSYRPLCVASFRLNYMLHGLDPMGYHLVNVVLHAVVCYLYVQLCAVVFTTILPALVAGLLFATHPIHTEAVAGVVGRAELMCAIFYLLALIFYQRHRNPWQHDSGESSNPKGILTTEGYSSAGGGGSVVTLCVCVVCAVCAMLCKEQGLTVLPVCLAQDVLIYHQNVLPVLLSRARHKPLPPNVKFFLRRVTILMGAAAALLLVRVLLMTSVPKFSELDNEALALPSPYRQLHWAYLVVVNIRLLLFPSALLHDYRMNAIPLLRSVWDPRHLLTLVAMTALLLLWDSALYRQVCTWNVGDASPGISGKLKRGRCAGKGQSSPQCMVEHGGPTVAPVVITGLLLLIIPFLPAANLFFPVGFVVAERILYMPSMGFSMLVAHSVHRMSKSRHKLLTFSVRALLLILLSFHSAKTVLRNRDWESKLNLYTSVLHRYPTNGYILANIARELRVMHDYKRAEDVYRHSILVAPGVLDSYVNLGSMLQAQNRFGASEEILRAALPLMVMNNLDRDKLSAIYTTLCNMIADNSSRLEEAAEFCKKAVQANQHLFSAHNSLGAVQMKRGESRSAIQSFKKAAALNRTSTTADYNLALVYVSLGHDMLALQTLQKVLTMETGHSLARRQLEEIRRRYYGHA